MSVPSPSSVVVADACPWSRRRVREILNAAGHRDVFEAADGAQAVGFLERGPPSLMVIDWALPVLGPAELVRLARDRRKETDPELPVLLTMIDPKASDIRKAMEAGLTAIVAKPFSAGMMRRRILDAGRAGPAMTAP